MRLYNSQFSLDVNEVRSGTDWLGAGKLHWALSNGEITIEPLTVNLPGGSINLAAAIKAVNDRFDIHLTGGVEQFDYGVLARRIKPATDMNGLINIAVDLHSKASLPETLLNNASGTLNFAVWPQEF